MFTPKNIQGALEELYDLCDPDYMVDMLVNYSEEFDDISPTLLARAFQKNAEMVCEYRVLSSAGDGIDYQGTVLLNSRAVRLITIRSTFWTPKTLPVLRSARPRNGRFRKNRQIP